MNPAPTRPGGMGRVRLVAVTVVLTSLAWIAGLGAWIMAAGHPPGLSTSPTGFVARPPAPMPQPLAAPAGAPAPPVSLVHAPSGLVIPVAGVAPGQLVDTFSQARAGGARIHDAIDIPAPRGTPVVAAALGTVERLFLSKDGGQTVYVRSPDRRLLYYYAHLDAYAPGLAEGQAVVPGAVLGTVGTTGNADPATPHLHFAIWQVDPGAAWYSPGAAINPYPSLAGAQRPELGALTQRSPASPPAGESRLRNDRPDRANAIPRSGPEVNSTRSPVIR